MTTPEIHDDDSAQSGTTRLHYLDNFRTYLTILVIFHHAAVALGGAGDWTYKSLDLYPPNTALVFFNGVNQSYFMASFFYLSGFMSARVLKRKTGSEFMKMKWIKLGIPTLAFTVFGMPIGDTLGFLIKGDNIRWSMIIEYWYSLRGVKGPVWYCALLLVFDTLYAFTPPACSFRTGLLSHYLPTPILLGALAAADFTVRLWWPTGTLFTPLNLQPAFLVQYIAAYIWGSSTTTENAVTSADLRTFSASLVCNIVNSVVLANYPLSSLSGGLNFAALSYAFWNEFTGFLLGCSILSLFSNNRVLRAEWANFGKYSYLAFLIHPIVLVVVQASLERWDFGSNTSGKQIALAFILGTLGSIGSWAAGWLLMRVPGMAKFIG